MSVPSSSSSSSQTSHQPSQSFGSVLPAGNQGDAGPRGSGQDAIASLLNLAAVGPRIAPMDSLVSAAMSGRSAAPRSGFVDPEPSEGAPLNERQRHVGKAAHDSNATESEDDLPLNLWRLKKRTLEEQTLSAAERQVKKAKAKPAAVTPPAQDDSVSVPIRRPGRPSRSATLVPLETIPVDTARPLESLLQEWVQARAEASPRWNEPQLADAIRRRVIHDNPKLGRPGLKSVMLRVMDLFGRLQGSDHERAVTAFCAGLGTRATVARQIGQAVIHHSDRLGAQAGPTIRLILRHLDEDALFAADTAGADRKAGKGPGSARATGSLLDELVATRGTLAGPLWQAVFAALHERHDAVGVFRVVEAAQRRAGSGWQGLPVMYEALGNACGQGGMPSDLLERCTMPLLQPPWFVVAGDGSFTVDAQARAALAALCRSVSATAWNPAHLQVLRSVWQGARDPAQMQARAELLEPLLCRPQGAQPALALRVKEVLAAAADKSPQAFTTSIVGPLGGFLSVPGTDIPAAQALVQSVCAALLPGLGRLTPDQARAVLSGIARKLNTARDIAPLVSFYEQLVRARVDTALITHLLDAAPPPAAGKSANLGLNAHAQALMRGAIAIEPAWPADEARALARLAIDHTPVVPTASQQYRLKMGHHLIETLALRDASLWTPWIVGYAQGLAGREDLAWRLASLLDAMALAAPRLTAASAGAFGRALAEGLGGRSMPAASARALLDQVFAAITEAPPALTPQLLRPLLDGIVDAIGGPAIADTLRVEVARAFATRPTAPSRAAGADWLVQVEELEVFRSVLGAALSTSHGSASRAFQVPAMTSSSSVTTSSPAIASPLRSEPVDLTAELAVVVPAAVPLAGLGPRVDTVPTERRIDAAIRTLFEQVDSGASTDQPHPALRELFSALVPAHTPAQEALRKLGDALARVLTSAARPPHDVQRSRVWRLPQDTLRREASDWIGRTVRSLNDSPDVAGHALMGFARLAGDDVTGMPPGHAELFAQSLATAMDMAHNTRALASVVQSMLNPRLTASFPASPADEVDLFLGHLATGLHRHLAAVDPQGYLPAALGCLLDTQVSLLGSRGEATEAQRERHRAVLRRLVGGMTETNLKKVWVAAASMSLQRMTLLVDLAAFPTGNASGPFKLNELEKLFLRVVTAGPDTDGAPPAINDEQAFRLCLAFALVNDRRLKQERQGLEPSAPRINTLLDDAIAAKLIAAPSNPTRAAAYRIAALVAHQPRKVLDAQRLTEAARTDLLCAMFEVPERFVAQQPAQVLASLVSAPLPEDLRLACVARLVRGTASRLGPQHLFSARRQLAEDLRTLALAVETALPSERDRHQERHDQGIHHLRQVYEGFKQLPVVAPLFAPGPVAPAWVVSHESTLREHLEAVTRDIAELRRAHQYAPLAKALLPVVSQVHDAIRQALETAQRAGQLHGQPGPQAGVAAPKTEPKSEH